jgi:hypothetical protein
LIDQLAEEGGKVEREEDRRHAGDEWAGRVLITGDRRRRWYLGEKIWIMADKVR